MGIYYDPQTLSWSVTPERTDYKTDYRVDYDTSRRTDYPTNLRTDYPIRDYLPTNLRFDYPVNLRTDYKTDYNTSKQFKINAYVGNNRGGRTYNVGGWGQQVSFVPNDNDEFSYQVWVSQGRGGRYETRTLRGSQAGLARALAGIGFPGEVAASRAQSFAGPINDVKRENNENRRKNEDNARTNAQNDATNRANQALNDSNYEANFRNAEENIRIQEQNNTNFLLNQQNLNTNQLNFETNQTNTRLNDDARELNENNTKLNFDNLTTNNVNTEKNGLYDKTVLLANTTRGGDFVSQRDQLTEAGLIQAGLDPTEAKNVLDGLKQQYKNFYLVEKLQRWDPNLGAQPPYGVFDPDYYKDQNPVVSAAYANAVAIDDIDITERYGEDGYYLQHYTNIGKGQGLRGNKEEDLVAADRYVEEALTDQEIQQIRDFQLGVDKDTITERLLNIPEVSNEWTKARNGDPYWKQLAKEKYLDVNKADEFSVLFRLSERPEDKQIIFNSNVAAGQGITQLEDTINEAIGAKAEVDVKKFAALNQTILKDTIAEMKRVRGEQEMLAFYRGFSGFTEVVDINKELSNSILGDTGVGGILSFTSGGKAEESLLGALENVTGMRNNVTYNWEKWFDEQIKNKYGLDYATFEPLEEKKDIIAAFTNPIEEQSAFDSGTNQFRQSFLDQAGFDSTESLTNFLEGQGEEGIQILNTIKGELNDSSKSVLLPIQARIEADIKTLDEAKDRSLALAYSTADKVEMMNIEAQFARDYIDEYLNPRFNTSRSMDEFMEYLDVRQEEQNPFQTQDTYNAMEMLSSRYSKEYLDNIKLEGPRSFDPDFYFDPIGDKGRLASYETQKKTVEEDWEKAKNGDPYWASQVYRFGIDVNNKAAFARMHFEIKGQGQGFDAAEDITNAGKVEDYLYQTVLPVLKEEAFKSDTVFGQFITPEEFADEMLRGLNPDDTPEEWKEILQRYGLEDFAGTVEELRDYIIETLRTGSALDIREQIKYLNEKRQRPTQEILGVTYIERPEDYKDEMAKPSTQLYAVFQNAGYQGTEDEFYENFFPDLDRTEQVLLTKAGKDDQLEMYGLDLSDPFASLGTIESFFTEDKDTEEETPSDAYTSYFKIGEEDIDENYKSTSGKEFLGEYTSLFKGLNV